MLVGLNDVQGDGFMCFSNSLPNRVRVWQCFYCAVSCMGIVSHRFDVVHVMARDEDACQGVV